MSRISLLTFIVGSVLSLLSRSANDFQIFYRYPGYPELFVIELPTDYTVGKSIRKICRERNSALNIKENKVFITFRGEISPDIQSLADAGIGSDALVDIIIMPLTPAQQILNAFANTNFRGLLSANEGNCYHWRNKFVKCDRAGYPYSITISKGNEFYGTIDFSLLPDTIEIINIDSTHDQITGEVDFLNLPRNLRKLIIKRTNFSADFSHMKRDEWPANLVEIEFKHNKLFAGGLNIGELPRSLITIDLSGNKQLHDISFNNYPPQLTRIELDGNILNELDLSKEVPVSLKWFTIFQTEIRGKIKLQGIRNCTELKFCTSEEHYDTIIFDRFRQAAFESRVSFNFLVV